MGFKRPHRTRSQLGAGFRSPFGAIGAIFTLELLLGLFAMRAVAADPMPVAPKVGQPPAAGRGPELVIQTGHPSLTESATFSPDGRQIATVGPDGAILWDAETGEVIRAFTVNSGMVEAVAFSPDGQHLLTGSSDKTASLWDVRTGANVRSFAAPARLGIDLVAFSPDGRRVFTGNTLGSGAVLWDAKTGNKVRDFGEQSGFLSAAFTSDSRQLCAVRGEFPNYIAALWDVETGREIRTFAVPGGNVTCAALCSRTGRVAAGWESDNKKDHRIVIWELTTGKEAGIIKADALVVRIAFSPDGRQLLTSLENGSVILWDVRTGTKNRALIGHKERVNSVAFSPDGRYALTASDDATAVLWDANSGERKRTFGGHDSPVTAVAFDADGRQLLVGAGRAVGWHMARGGKVQFFGTPDDLVRSLVVSRDGRQVVTAFANKAVLWNAESGEKVRVFAVNKDGINHVALSPDGSRLLLNAWPNGPGRMASDKETATLWDVGTGKKVRDLDKDGIFSRCGAFSPDGRQVLTGSWHGGATFWDAQTGEPRNSFDDIIEDGPIWSITFSPDGQQVLSGSMASLAVLWSRGDWTQGEDIRYGRLYCRPRFKRSGEGRLDRGRHFPS